MRASELKEITSLVGFSIYIHYNDKSFIIGFIVGQTTNNMYIVQGTNGIVQEPGKNDPPNVDVIRLIDQKTIMNGQNTYIDRVTIYKNMTDLCKHLGIQ